MEISKTARILALTSFLTLILSGTGASAQAVNPVPNTGQPPAANGQPSHTHGGEHIMAIARQNPSCQNILNECKKLGFIDGQWKQDNGLWKDCFDPIVKGKGTPTRDGQPVNVPVNPSDIQTCHATIAAAHKPQQ